MKVEVVVAEGVRSSVGAVGCGKECGMMAESDVECGMMAKEWLGVCGEWYGG